MIWGAISKKGKIAFTFVDGILNGDTYLKMLQNFVP